jgi:predicted  nucleic acid-binding Zn-ribbon protein
MMLLLAGALSCCTMLELQLEVALAKKSRLTRVAVKIGTAMGRADRKAHQIAKAGVLAKKELADISKQVDALKRQLLKTTKRLKRALA